MSRRDARALTPALDSELLSTVRNSVLAQSGPLTSSRIATALKDSGRLLGSVGSLDAVERITAELQGFGPLQPLLRDAAVTDLYVNGPRSVWLDRGHGVERANVEFESELTLRALAVRLISAGGRRLDESSPCVDVRLDGGFRVHAVIPPVSTSTLISVRIRRPKVFSVAELTGCGFLSPESAAILSGVVDRRLSFMISGSTGSGKTTLLSTLLGLCGTGERLVLIEDAAELNPDHPHTVTLESRHANAEGAGAVDLAELVRQALRMSPTRLIVGECRGAEVRELLAALNTGHSGGGGTVHANSSSDVPARLAALGALAGLSQEAVALQAASALDVVFHLERCDGVRRLAEIGIVDYTGNRLVVVPAWQRTGPAPGPARGPAWGRLLAMLDRPAEAA